MNKGIKILKEILFVFLNTDDFYYEDSLSIVNKYFNLNNIDFCLDQLRNIKSYTDIDLWKIKWSFSFYSFIQLIFLLKEKNI